MDQRMKELSQFYFNKLYIFSKYINICERSSPMSSEACEIHSISHGVFALLGIDPSAKTFGCERSKNAGRPRFIQTWFIRKHC